MNSKERLVKALDYLKEQNPKLSNPVISRVLNYNANNYVADILSGAKPINALFLKRLKLEYSINPEWIQKGIGNMLVFENETKSKSTTSHDDLIKTLLERIAALTKTQNLILEQNQVQIVDGIKKIQTDVTQSMLDNQGRASAISDEIQDWSLQILKAVKAPGSGAPVKPSGKNAGKHNRKSVKPDNHTGVNK